MKFIQKLLPLLLLHGVEAEPIQRPLGRILQRSARAAAVHALAKLLQRRDQRFADLGGQRGDVKQRLQRRGGERR